MCGIVGLIAKQSQGFYGSHVDIFTDMLLMDQVRGMDGTGVFGVYKNKQAYLAKAGTHASNFVGLKEYSNFKEKMLRSMMMVFGHNRKATVGNVSSQNSHPFLEDNIILLHNGFIGNAREFDSSSPVDSQALARGLNKGTALEILPKVSGAYALIWYDKRDKVLRMARNADRPLFVAETDNFLAFASEPWTILGALSPSRRNTDVKIKDVAPLDKHVLFEFTGLGEIKTTPYTPRSFTSYQQKWQGWEGECGYESSDCSGLPTPVHSPTNYVPDRNNYPPRTTVTPLPSLKQKWDELIRKLPEVGRGLDFQVDRVFSQVALTNLQVEGHLMVDGTNIDISGVVDWTNNIKEVHECVVSSRQRKWLTGEITAKGATNSGPWIRIKNVYAPSMISTWNKNVIPQYIWECIEDGHKCAKCSAEIMAQEAPFTSVKLNSDGDVTKVVCAKCVTQGLERDDNEETSTSTLQIGQPVSQSSLH